MYEKLCRLICACINAIKEITIHSFVSKLNVPIYFVYFITFFLLKRTKTVKNGAKRVKSNSKYKILFVIMRM